MTVTRHLFALLLVGATLTSVARAGNPLIQSRFCADPSPHVFGDVVYLYATNDEDNSGNYWDSTDWRLFSSRDMATWKDHGSFLSVKVFDWCAADAKAWAPCAATRNGKYYFYAPVGGTQIGVAVSHSPTGPFADPIGRPLIDKARDANAGDEPIDPFVFVDDDGQGYLYFGTRVPKVVRLKEDMVTTDGPILDVEIDLGDKKYGEAPWLHERDGIYYFTFSTGWPGQIVHATGDSPLGPFTYRGVVFDFLEISTNHQAIMKLSDQWYLFYHDNLRPGGGSHKRSIAAEYLHHNPDGSISQVVATSTGVTATLQQ